MLRIFLILCTIYACTNSLTAQDSLKTKKSSTTISGFGDVYYRFDITGKTIGNNKTSFTNSHNNFELGMASLKVEHEMFDRVGIVADIGFGNRASEFSYNETGILAAIKQMYIYYQPKSWLKFTVGSWATHVGYEVVDPFLNNNYSMSYMFSYGPFFHTGIKAEFTKGNHSFMVGIANPTDYKSLPLAGVNRKFALAQYSVSVNDYLTAYINYAGGQSPDSLMSNQIDLVLTSDVSNKVSLAFNGTYSQVSDKPLESNVTHSNGWYGAALYATYSPKDWVSISARTEYFNDKYNLKVFSPFLTGGHVYEATLSAGFKVYGFTFIPEFRFDGSNRNIFIDSNGKAVPYNASFTIAAIYNFSFTKKFF
jgi:hypothetical protein